MEGPLFEPAVKKQAHANLGLVCGNMWVWTLEQSMLLMAID